MNGTSEEIAPAAVPLSGPALDDAALSGPGSYRHGAAVVATERGLLDVALPYLREGLDGGDLTVVSCTPETADRILHELDSHGLGVEFDPGLILLGSRPPDIFTHYRQFAHRAGREGAGRLRVLCEVAVTSDPRHQREEMRVEAVANEVMADLPVTSLCLYDGRRLAPHVLASAAATHPHVVTGPTWADNPAFQDPAAYIRGLPTPREPLEDRRPVVAVDDAPTLPQLRRRLTGALPTLVADEEQLEDLRLGISEVAANAFRHGLRPVSGRLWSHDHRLVCEVTDSGTTFDDPLTGFIPAHGFDLGRGGMGLWLARKLFDHVDLLPGPSGFTVRLSTTLR